MIKNNLTKAFCLIVTMGLFLASCSDDDDSVDDDFDDTVSLYTTNNANGNITVYEVDSDLNATSTTLVTTSTAADGAYYDDDTNSVFQASRSDNNLEGYANVDMLSPNTELIADFIGTSDMESPREIAVRNNFYVVADNADVDGNDTTPDGRFFIYNLASGTFTLQNIITVNFKVWGITFKDNDLYAVVDTTNELAVFTNFLSNTSDANLSASKRIAIEGIVRTHGITYDDDSDTMILTDIGDAGNAQDDGGFHIIAGFTNKFNAVANGDTMSVAGNQVRVSGSSTMMGNPVDVAYDSDNDVVYIAEAGNGGGRILAFSDFDFSTGGNISPSINNALPSASSVYLDE